MARKRYRVQWTAPATEDLLRAAEFIRQDRPAAARRLYHQLLQETRQLERTPFIGRVVPEFGHRLLRELIASPYRIIYRIVSAEYRIEVLAVVHGARLLRE